MRTAAVNCRVDLGLLPGRRVLVCRYREGGIVRTNLAGGLSAQQIQQEYGKDAVEELDRVGALTGVADTSGSKKDLYFCHDRCELGAPIPKPTVTPGKPS